MQLAVLHILHQKRNSWQKSRWVDGREKTILGFEIQKILWCRRVEITEAQNLLGSVPVETKQSSPPAQEQKKGFPLRVVREEVVRAQMPHLRQGLAS